MADITMCRDHDCKFKNDCYRYTAKPNTKMQSYFVESPRDQDECSRYWSNHQRWRPIEYDEEGNIVNGKNPRQNSSEGEGGH